MHSQARLEHHFVQMSYGLCIKPGTLNAKERAAFVAKLKGKKGPKLDPEKHQYAEVVDFCVKALKEAGKDAKGFNVDACEMYDKAMEAQAEDEG